MNWLLLLLAADVALASLGFSAVAGGMWGYRVVVGCRSRKGRRRASYLKPPRQIPLAAPAPHRPDYLELHVRNTDRPGHGPTAPAGLTQTARLPRVGDGPGPAADFVRGRAALAGRPSSLPLTSPQRRPGGRL